MTATESRVAAHIALLVGALLCAAALSSCHARPLLSDVWMAPEVISPNADGSADATNIHYTLARNAAVSIYFQDVNGTRRYFRQGRPRSAGQYQVQWGGVINERSWTEMEAGADRQLVLSRVLQDGDYTWVVEAVGEDGEVQSARGTITLRGGDAVVPELRRFTVARPEFTPNQDGLGDRTGVSYHLSKDVESAEVYLYSPSRPSERYPLEEQQRTIEPGVSGYHFYDYDGGVDLGADPPPDGLYVVQAEARDGAGHHVVVSSTLTLTNGGKPRADVVNGTIHWGGAVRSRQSTEMYVALGETLVFTTYVENYGSVPIRTSGPPPGTCYESTQNSNALADQAGDASWHEQAGVWRFGVNLDVSQTDFPYRWAVGLPEELRCEMIEGHRQCFLDPGERGTVTGCIKLAGPFPRLDVYAWGGLIHEWVGISEENNYVDRVLLHIGAP